MFAVIAAMGVFDYGYGQQRKNSAYFEGGFLYIMILYDKAKRVFFQMEML